MTGKEERGTGALMLARVSSERGSVGVVMAFVIFVVLGMLTMTWNTAQLSKAKMRLQNAADSAALAHAVWQARGMNAVQNINDEMYEALTLSTKLRKISAVLEGIAIGFDAASNIPVVGPIFKGLAVVFHLFGVLSGAPAGWMAARICDKFLKYIQQAYVYGSALFGLWNAQQLAAQNEADPLAKLESTSSGGTDSWHFGIYTLGLSWPLKDAFMLPLGKSGKCDDSPWTAQKLDIYDGSTQPWKTIYNIAGTPEGWNIKPYVSKRGDKEGIKVEKKTKDGKEVTVVDEQGVLPGPTMWIAFKLGKNIQTLPLDGFWNADDKDRSSHSLPMFAVAAAQCITGDVVPHSEGTKDGVTNQRPEGFGAGATAKLVPVSQVFYAMSKAGKVAGTVVDAIVYH